MHKWVERQQITRLQAAKIIGEILVEVLFDVTQALVVTCELRQNNSIPNILFLIKAEQVVARAEQGWQAWQAAGMANFSPNLAPILKPVSQPQQQTERLHQTLNRLMNGDKTLRDIAAYTKRDLVQLGRLLLPFINSGIVRLVEVADLAAPSLQKPTEQQKPLIACIDDSLLVCRALEEIISAAGYRFIAVNDSQQAIQVLSARQPDLIFLDIEMPKLDGYEVCSQLRRLPAFLNTPIIFLTGYDGIFDRVRAKLAGSSGFLSKTVAVNKVIEVIQKHLFPAST